MTMPWKCPDCGFETLTGTHGICGGCGSVHFGRLILVRESDGAKLSVSVDTEIGKRLLEKVGGEDAQFASSPQFTVKKDDTLGGWVLSHASSARNQTFLNGSAIPGGPALLKDGDTLSIGPEKAKLVVRIEV